MKDRPIRKVLFVRLSSLGDILHAVPAQQAMWRTRPEIQIHWLAEPAFLPLLESVPGIAKVWPVGLRRVGTRSGLAQLLATVRALRRERFDCALDFQGLLKSAILARLTGSRRVIGFASDYCREHAAAWLYSAQIAPKDRGQHVIEQNLALVERLGVSPTSSPLIPLKIPAAAEQKVIAELKNRNISHPVLINPGAGWPTKLWGTVNYASLADAIASKIGAQVVLTFGPGEEHLVREIQALSHSRPAAFPTSFFELASLCRQSRLMIAGDTGPLHMAVAMGTPTVAILGPTTASRNGPFNPADLVVKRDLPCSDCYKRSCSNFICMEISPEEVLRAVRRRLAQ